jgi:hypothetical protein
VTFERFEHVLADVVGGLPEPRPPDVDHALKQLALLVESLTGVAVGIAVGQIGAAIRRGFGEAARAAVDRQLAVMSRTALVPVGDAASGRFVGDAEQRPLVDELGMRLHVRLRRAVPIAAGLVRQVRTTVARVAPHQLKTLAMTLELACDDDSGAIVFGDHLQLGWRYYGAVTTRVAEPEVADSARWRRVRETWRAWSHRVDPDRADGERAPSHEEIVANGFVMRIG